MRRPKPPFFLIPNLLVVVLVTVMATLSPAIPCSWAQTTAHSPESFLDCKQIDFGSNIFDRNMNCCLPGEQTCQKCFYTKSKCENVFGCDTTATQDVNGTCCFDGQKTCGKCYYTKTHCESQLGVCGTTATADSRGTCCQASQQACGECNHHWACPAHYGCGRQPNACGDCAHQRTCCLATLHPGIAPGANCVAFTGWGGCKDCVGNNTGFFSIGWKGYINKITVTYSRSWCAEGGWICGSMRCYENCNTSGLANIGCFDPKATILLEGGALKAAEDIRVGDLLYNPMSGRSLPVKRVLSGPEKIPMVELGFGGNLLRVTQDHPVLTKDGMRRANKIEVGDVVIDASGNEHAVEYARLAPLINGQMVLNFELDTESNDPIERLIVADNVTSGDLAVQNSALPGEE